MKKLTFFFLTGLLFGCLLAGCSREEPVPSLSSEPTPAVGNVRSVPEALSELDAVLDHLDASTRSGVGRSYSLSNVAVAGCGGATRSDETPSLPDTLAYVVNFDRGEGFAVLGARRGSAPVYAVTEQGALDPAKLDEAIAEAYARLTQQEAESAPETRSNPEAGIREIGIDIVPKLLGQALVAESLSSSSGGIADWGNTPGPTPQLVDVIYGDWEVESIYGPVVETKWGQEYPFNLSCPVLMPTDNLLKGRCAVGCGVVALAQILACNRRPTLAPSYEGKYSWNELTSICNYTNLPIFYWSNVEATLSSNPTYMTRAEHLANFLYFLGGKNYCAATYGYATSVASSHVRNAMKLLDPGFYQSATYCSYENNSFSIYKMLEEGKPVYIEGGYPGTSGHAWILDGYLKRKRVKEEIYWSSQTGKYSLLSYQYGKLLHCNWGNWGDCDGYYVEDVFDWSQRIYRDAIIDEHINTVEGGGKYYGVNVILY